jgi:hypothetical protein
VLASVLRGNPLRDDLIIDVDLPGEMVVTWSGTLAERPFDRHPLTWLKPGHMALARFIADVAPQLRRHHRRLVLRPHSRHVLSDVQSCVTFARDHGDAPVALALDPVSLLEPSMLTAVEDHVTRMFELLAGHSAMIILSDAKTSRLRSCCVRNAWSSNWIGWARRRLARTAVIAFNVRSAEQGAGKVAAH